MFMIKLKRIYLPTCTIGALKVEDYVCCTMELPWQHNHKNVSCIPAGMYKCRNNHMSPSKGKCISVEGVVGREHILIHVGNWTKDLLGCIGVGESISALNTEPMVANSKKTLTELMSKLPDEFLLVVE